MEIENNTLIVVCKDELIVNELHKLVYNYNRMQRDYGDNIGNRITITVWTEEEWLQEKKCGEIDSKVLLIGDITGTENLIPVLDVKFNNYGVKYGWAGNRAVLIADIKALKSTKDYIKFCAELQREITAEEYRENIPVERVKKMTKTSKMLIEIPIPVVGLMGIYKNVKGVKEDIKKVKRQQYLYGIDVFYKRDFENFMAN